MSYLPRKDDRIAFVMSPRIGDTLISMVLVRNLVRHGYDVTIFSSHLTVLRDWFPGFRILPPIAPAQARSVLAGFDIVMHAYAKDAVGDVREWHPCAWVMNEWPIYLTLKPMIEIQLDVCREVFGIADAGNDNGMVIPAGVDTTVVANRVVIHPTASNPHKQWLCHRFMRLADRLRNRGYDVCFVVAPDEREQWQWVEARGFELVSHDSLSRLAQWLVQAGILIGNDSGLAHLASNIGVPTVSLAKRRRIAMRWAPGWAPTRVVTPISILPGGRAREALWKYVLPVFKVLGAMDDLRKAVAATPRAFGADGSRLRRSDIATE